MTSRLWIGTASSFTRSLIVSSWEINRVRSAGRSNPFERHEGAVRDRSVWPGAGRELRIANLGFPGEAGDESVQTFLEKVHFGGGNQFVFEHGSG
jgi:hypothetical protein